MLKQSLQQKLQQKLAPQQIQMIKLLEVPLMDLEQRIKVELQENPALEEGNVEPEIPEEPTGNEEPEKDFSLDEYTYEEDIPSYKLHANNYSGDEKNTEIPFSAGTTFHEHLVKQLSEQAQAERDQLLCEYLIGNIDEDGYLRRDLLSIIDDLAFNSNVYSNEEEMTRCLKIIFQFDPPGVGARTLQECLLLQLKRKSHKCDAINLAIKIIDEDFEEFTKKHYERIIRKYGVTEDELKLAIEEILHLNPKPGGAYNNPYNNSVQQIIPDFLLDLVDNELVLTLNSKNVPELRVSRTYSDMLQSYSSSGPKANKAQKQAAQFVRQKLDSARWFIDAIRQRQQTLLYTMQAILDRQSAYFIEGDETLLLPMKLKDIADKTGYDVSTISRVSNSKYIQTHFGIFPLKYFFSESMQTDSGEEVSSREIKQILFESIENEDKRKPITDDKLATILKEKGYVIARRTVAKYREQLNIPVARLRKEL